MIVAGSFWLIKLYKQRARGTLYDIVFIFWATQTKALFLFLSDEGPMLETLDYTILHILHATLHGSCNTLSLDYYNEHPPFSYYMDKEEDLQH